MSRTVRDVSFDILLLQNSAAKVDGLVAKLTVISNVNFWRWFIHVWQCVIHTRKHAEIQEQECLRSSDEKDIARPPQIWQTELPPPLPLCDPWLISGRESVTLPVATPPYPYSVAYRRDCELRVYGMSTMRFLSLGHG